MRRGLVDQLRDLETAHARLMAKLKVQAETISGLSSAQKTATSATSDAWEAGYSQGIAEYQSQVDELQKELDIAKLEKLRLQTQMLEREQKEQSSKVKLSTGDIQLSADDSSSTALVITDGDDREDARTRDDAEGVLREALSWFAHGRKIDALLSQVRGISIAGRFIVKEVATVEADAITLACADAFKKREVTLKTPIVDCREDSRKFLAGMLCLHSSFRCGRGSGRHSFSWSYGRVGVLCYGTLTWKIALAAFAEDPRRPGKGNGKKSGKKGLAGAFGVKGLGVQGLAMKQNC